MSTLIQRSFASGVIDPALHARVDQSRYATGLRTGKNGFIPKTGGFSNRPGTKFIYELPGTVHRLIEWISRDGSYVFIFNANGTVRVFQNGESLNVIVSPPTWNIGTTYYPGEVVLYSGVKYYARTQNIGFQPDINPTQWYAMPAGYYEFPHPYGSDIDTFKYIQDQDVMMIANATYYLYDLKKSGDRFWFEVWPAKSFDSNFYYGVPSIDTPSGVAASSSPGSAAGYCVTAVGFDFEESLQSVQVTTSVTPSPGTPCTVSWSAVTGARYYKVYRFYYSVAYLIGITAATSLVDPGVTPDPTSDTAPIVQGDFLNTGTNRPATIGRFQQRTLLGDFTANSEAVYGSITGFRQNFSIKFPASDDAAISFAIRGRRENAIKHFLDLGVLVIFTSDGEWIVRGDQGGILKASTAIPEQYSYNGSGDLPPIVIGSDAIYVQRQGNIVRALGFDINAGGRDGFRDSDLTFFAKHFFKNRTIVSWAYQKTPHYIIWMVRDDGKMLSFTFNREQQIIAFCEHETDGEFKNVVCVPEGTDHIVYAVVKRTIDGSDVYYFERMYERDFSSVVDAVFVDSAKEFDGTDYFNVTISGGTAWDDTEILTLTETGASFTSGMVGEALWFTDANGDVIRIVLTEYNSPSVMKGIPHKTVPVALRNVAVDCDYARKFLSGLDHLEGKDVSVFADGDVIASPNNPSYGVLTVTGGEIELPSPQVKIYVGLPFIADMETLDIDTAQGETIVDKQKLVQKVTMHVEETRGLFVGGREPTASSIDGLTEVKVREEEDYEESVELKTGVVDVVIESHWNSNGRVFVRQVDPLPFTIQSVAPAGLYPFR